MALLLHRIGRFSYRRAWLVIVGWVVVLGALVGGGVALGGQLQESYAIPGTESQDALDTLEAVFPQTAGASANAIVQAPEGGIVESEPYRSAIEEMTDELEGVDGVASATSPFDEYAGNAVSGDGRTAYIQVQFDGQVTDVTDAQIEAVTDTAAVGEDAGLLVAFGGDVFQETEFGLTITEAFGVIFAAVVLVITFGSLLAAGMPLLGALVGVGVAFGGISIAAAFTTVSSTAPMLAVMIGLAVGIDYALFILSRHRTQLARGADPEDSAAEAVATAGGAVVFAGLTVIIALLGLLVVGIPFLSVMGLSAALAVLVAVLCATTLLPAVMGLAKGRLAPKPGGRTARRALAADEGGSRPLGRRWVDGVLKAPIVAALAVVGVLGVAAVPALSLDLNLPTSGSEPEGTPTREAYDLMAEGFGPGYNGPLVITVDITQTTDVFDDLDAIGARIAQLDGVEYVADGIPNATVDTAIIRVIPETAPDDPQTKALVESIRELEPEIADEFGTPIAVTGYTAISIDISNRLSDALIPFALIVVGLSVLLLMVVFRSLYVPLTAALGFLLSAFAAIGATVAIFQWGWFADLLHVEPGPILSFLPIILMAVLFGLAMDYQVFLVSGMREEYVRTGRPRQSVVHGFQHAARVVTAAALIMFFVFFAFVPEGSGVIKGIAFALAVGVAFDAFLVRMTLVPAAMALAGRAAWWLPVPLAKLLPDVDIEGEGLRHHLDDANWAARDGGAIGAEAAVFGLADEPIGPVDVAVPAGGVLHVTGAPAARRIVGATLAGRLDPVAGRLHVLGSPLPSDAPRVLRRVAIVDLPGAAADGHRTVREVVAERADAAAAWWRLAGASAATDRALDRLHASGVEVDPERPLGTLDPVARAAVQVTAALAEHPDLLVVELDDAVPAARHADWAALLDRLVPGAVTLVVGGADDTADALPTRRERRTLDLAPLTLDRKARLR
ncbi:MMPL family transporter [Agromyces sp. SYSU T00194]|uniref:MMPL family transporter n=1 Tax=Agromyces chitinivorans TaxID=3158560 RepID=UPI003398B3DE